MGFFKRLFRIGQAEVNNTLDGFEDPIKMTEQGIREMEQDLDKSIKALAEVKASCVRSKNELDKAKQSATDYENKAMMLLKRAEQGAMSGDEADRLATMALQKKSETVQGIPTLQANYDKYCAAVAKLEDSVKKLRANISKWKNEAKMLKARAKVSEATANVNKQLAGIDSTDTIAMLERMKEKVDQQEALAESYLDIANAETGADAEIDSALESTGGSIEASSELAALKARMSEAKAIESSVESSKAISNGAVSDLDMLKQKMAEPQAAQTADVSEAQQQADQSAL
ncbi:MAG: PspA/IM30 family protein [Bacteroidales bacterium]|nr:PspA/IM30 family protein [Bacteroidales bacterium]